MARLPIQNMKVGENRHYPLMGFLARLGVCEHTQPPSSLSDSLLRPRQL